MTPSSVLGLYPAAIAHVAQPRSCLVPSVRSPRLLLALLHTPRALAAVVGFVDWAELYPLLCTCTSLHDALFDHMPTRDVVLARFVPGFSFCLRHRDIQLYQDVPITIHDLDLLLISQRTDLHRYPTHALRTLTAPALTDHALGQTTIKLIKLTQAHSRFVLLLQSLVHSSPLAIPPDPPEDRSSHQRFPEPSPELTFPPPLAFTPPPLPPKDIPRKRHKHSYRPPQPLSSPKPSASAYVVPPSPTLSRPQPHPLRIPSHTTHKPKHKHKHKSCLSIFGSSDLSPPPPPPEEPQTLRIRSKEWRRARSASIVSSTSRRPPHPGRPRAIPYAHAHSVSLDFDNPTNAHYPSDSEFDFGRLRRPRRLFASEHSQGNLPSSSSSSISIPDTRSSWNQGQGSTRSSRSSPPVSPYGYSHPRIPFHSRTPPSYATGNGYPTPPFAPSIHSLLHATIRNRAPVLRVFIPTQHMHLPPSSDKDPSPMSSLDSSPEREPSPQSLASLSIRACENQLQDAGLWEHLSTGDVICNFGYIPLDDGEPIPGPSDSVYTPKALHRPSLRSFSHLPYPNTHPYPIQQQQPHRTTWLIFTGQSLLPYTPPSLLPLPSSSPLSLPSPFYYYHILPAGMNPLFEISELPPLSPISGGPAPDPAKNISLALIKTTSLIPSPLSPTGFAKVNKFAWTARVLRARPFPSPSFAQQPPPPHAQISKNNPFAPLVYHHPPPPPGDLIPNHPLPPLPLPEELGDGWLGEWVVEYEGTSEGRELLLALLEGKVVLGRGRVWEVRRERSGGGRVWMRLLPE